jgi:hypothetical protein
MARVVGALRRGELPFGPVRVHDLGKRKVVVLDPIDRIVARALAVRARTAFEESLPAKHRSARVLSTSGQPGSIAAFEAALRRAHEHRDEVDVVAFDVRRAYPSLSARRAIDVFEELTRAKGIANALRGLYAHVGTQTPKLAGLFEGLATSAVLQDVALLAMDDIVAPNTDDLFRYADDSVAILPQGISPDQAWTALDAAERAYTESGDALRIHRRVHARVHSRGGFLNPFEWLGIRFEGEERFVGSNKLAELRHEVGDPTKDPEDVIAYYRKILTSSGRRNLEEALTSESPTGQPEGAPHAQEALIRDKEARGAQDPTTAKGRGWEAARAPSPVAGGGNSPRPPGNRGYSQLKRLHEALRAQSLLDADDAEWTHRGERFRRVVVNLSTDGGHGSQYQAYCDAVDRAEQLMSITSRSPRRPGHALAMICGEFVATNSFVRRGSPANLTALLRGLETNLDVHLIAVRRTTGEILYCHPDVVTSSS